MTKPFFYIAIIGWILGIWVHLLAVSDIDVTGKFPFVWLLHLGVFVVWIPAILRLRNNRDKKDISQERIGQKFSPLQGVKTLFKNTPPWLVVIAIVGLAYAFLNFTLFMTRTNYTPVIQDGKYVLLNHGEFIRNVTEKEYHHIKANTMRSFSGNWIAFYGLAMAFLYPFKKNGTNNETEGR